MKKTILFILMIIIASCGEAYKATAVSTPPISESFELEGTKNDLYVRANNWLVESFGSAKAVREFSDKEEGVISGKYLVGTVYSKTGRAINETPVNAVVRIQVKDGAAKLTLTPSPYNYIAAVNIPDENEITEGILQTRLQEVVDSFRIYMSKREEAF